MPSDRLDHDQPDEDDPLFELHMQRHRAYLDDWDAEVARWEAWRAELDRKVEEARLSGRPAAEALFRQVPDWHRPDAAGLLTFGWHGDHEWAVTEWADPKYL